jgi:hypothetical protein
MGYSAKSPMPRAGSLATAFHCLYDTGLLLSDHFSLKQGGELAAINAAFQADATAMASAFASIGQPRSEGEKS